MESYKVMKTGCFANVERIVWRLILEKLNQSPSKQIWRYSCKKMSCECLLHNLPKCTWVCSWFILQLCSYTAAIFWTLSELQPEWWLDVGPFCCISKMVIYCVIFSYIQFIFPQTSKCFLSNGTKNMHILASGPEIQAVRFGYVISGEIWSKGG
jgi:hypothetical protein